MTDLFALTTPRSMGEGHYDFEVPDGWQQGRGAFGGFVVAVLARAIEAHAGGPDRAPRSLSVELPGATLPGPARVRVETLRAGARLSTVTARLEQQGEVRAHAVGVLGRDLDESTAPRVELARPAPRSWRETPELPLAGFGPTFARHFEFRSDGPLPFSGGAESRTEGWIRARELGALAGAAKVAAYVDAWWPAVYTVMAAPRPIATVTYVLQLVAPLDGLDPAAPLFHRAHAVATAAGYSAEVRELWGEDGRLVALNTQTFVVIG